jgi:hypothetical protein
MQRKMPSYSGFHSNEETTSLNSMREILSYSFQENVFRGALAPSRASDRQEVACEGAGYRQENTPRHSVLVAPETKAFDAPNTMFD